MALSISVTPERRKREIAAGTWRDRLTDDYLRNAAERVGDRLLVVDGSVTLTYAEVNARVDALAASLQSLDVSRGDVVSWQLPNWYEAYLLHQAIVRIGAVSNPIVPIYRQREVSYILQQSRSRVFVMPESFRGFSYVDLLEDIRSSVPDVEHVVRCRGSARSGFLDFDDLCAGTARPEPVSRTADDPVLLLFTSGTTANPKGAVHTHNTLDCEDQSIIDTYELTENDVIFMPSPVSHISGLLYGLHLPSMVETTVVFQDVWEPGEALALIEKYRCAFTIAATPFLHGLTYHPDLPSRDVSSMRVFGCGGADVPPGLIRDARERLGCLASRVYGSTEFPTLTATGPHDPADKGALTDGRAIGAATYRILDEDDNPLPPGEVGELVLAGPELFLGYLRQEDNVGAFLSDGYFRTGDLAAADGDGFLTIRGRKKDIVLRGGENISVTEIENLLFDHPQIAEIAIVAMPDPVMVERACAFVVPREGAEPTLGDLASFLGAQGVAKQKIPERLEIVPELPTTQSGKVQKFRLREIIRGTLEREQQLGVR